MLSPSALPQPVTASSPQITQSVVGAESGPVTASGASQHTVKLFDAYDPETFNAALGAGTCARSGGVTFTQFLEQLGAHQSIGSWHFTPSIVTMQVGQQLVATNQGGETHTFTEVEEFGGES
jgi:hypothetical protein